MKHLYWRRRRRVGSTIAWSAAQTRLGGDVSTMKTHSSTSVWLNMDRAVRKLLQFRLSSVTIKESRSSDANWGRGGGDSFTLDLQGVQTQRKTVILALLYVTCGLISPNRQQKELFSNCVWYPEIRNSTDLAGIMGRIKYQNWVSSDAWSSSLFHTLIHHEKSVKKVWFINKLIFVSS